MTCDKNCASERRCMLHEQRDTAAEKDTAAPCSGGGDAAGARAAAQQRRHLYGDAARSPGCCALRITLRCVFHTCASSLPAIRRLLQTHSLRNKSDESSGW
jgi:hypothetical protein